MLPFLVQVQQLFINFSYKTIAYANAFYLHLFVKYQLQLLYF